MGMNYYLRSKPCPTCQHVDVKKHIGKASTGWEFFFQGFLDDSIVSYADWINEFSDEKNEIVDELGEVMGFEAFNQMVCARKGLMNHFNVTKGVPLTEKEKEYCKDRHNHCGYSPDAKVWKDNQGFAFTESTFS